MDRSLKPVRRRRSKDASIKLRPARVSADKAILRAGTCIEAMANTASGIPIPDYCLGLAATCPKDAPCTVTVEVDPH